MKQRARLLFDNNVKTQCRRRVTTMVKRAPRITVGSASIASAATGDIKKDQKWMYPGGVVARHKDLVINGRTYTDDKNEGERRRKHESNFFITINTNKAMTGLGVEADLAKRCVKETLDYIAETRNICGIIKFGPKSTHYQDDRFDDVIESIEWNAAVETGEKLDQTQCRRRVTTMVKRAPRITVGSASIASAATGDIKKDQKWMYPGGVVARHKDLVINGRTYTDDKNEGERRRKHESNFFITINTNKAMTGLGVEADLAKRCVKETLDYIAETRNICGIIKFGPKSTHYQDDRFDDVIESMEWNAAVETGEKRDRLHAHVWLTLHHYSQVQVNMPMLARMFKQQYNERVKGYGLGKSLQISRQPYVNVKLLPTSDWAQVIHGYMRKAMVD